MLVKSTWHGFIYLHIWIEYQIDTSDKCSWWSVTWVINLVTFFWKTCDDVLPFSINKNQCNLILLTLNLSTFDSTTTTTLFITQDKFSTYEIFFSIIIWSILWEQKLSSHYHVKQSIFFMYATLYIWSMSIIYRFPKLYYGKCYKLCLKTF